MSIQSTPLQAESAAAPARSERKPWVALGRLGDAVLPALAPIAMAAALAGDAASDWSALALVHILATLAWLLAFWRRPERPLRRGSGEIACQTICGLLFAWIVLNYARSAVREATYAYAILGLDAALLFYASARSVRRRPQATLACWAFVLLAMGALVALPNFSAQGRAAPSDARALGPLAAGAGALGLAAWFAMLEREGRRARLWLSGLVLGMLTLGAVGLLTAARMGLPALHGAYATRSFYAAEIAQSARSAFRSRPLGGTGLGTFVRRLRGQGIGMEKDEALRLTDSSLLPPAPLAAAASPQSSESEAQDPESASASSLGTLSAIELFAVELGAGGVGLLLVLGLALFFRSIFWALRAPDSPLSSALLGLTGVAVFVASSALTTSALHDPFGILLLGTLGGLLWGIASRLSRGVGVPVSTRARAAAVSSWARTNGLLLGALEKVGAKAPPAQARQARPSLIAEAKHEARREGLHNVLRRCAIVCGALTLLAPIVLPSWGLRIAHGVAVASLGQPQAGARLRLAGVLNPLSAEIALLQARHATAVLEGQGEAARDPVLAIEAEDALYGAIERDRYSDSAYAALAAFYMRQGETFKMTQAIASGRRAAPRSLLLALWAAQYAEVERDPQRLEGALRAALRLSSAGPIEVRLRLLERLAQIYEQRGDFARALDATTRLFQCDPTDAQAGEAMRRLARWVYSQEIQEKKSEEVALGQ